MNPYNYKNPVYDVSEFFGRKALVSKIYSRIGAMRPQSVSVVGDYKIGKTSLLHYLIQPEIQIKFLDDPQNYIFLFISIRDSEKNTLQDFIIELCLAIAEKVDGDFSFTTIKACYSWYKRTVENLTKQGKKFILFLDDFNLVTQNSDFPLEFFSFLRSLANNFNVAYVTSSYQDLQKLCFSKDVEESPFFNIFTNITLRAFEQDVIREIIIQKNSDKAIPLDKQISITQAFTGGFPYLVQLAGDIFYSLHDFSKASDIVQPFSRLYYEKSKPFFSTLWDNLEEEYQMLLLQTVSRQSIPESQMYMINELIRKNYLFKSDKHYKLFSPTFNKFIREEIQTSTPLFSRNFFSQILKFLRRTKRDVYL